MAQKLNETDVVIIGLGAAGSIAALELSKHGLEVIGLEAGPWRTIKDFPSDEIRNDIRNYVGNPKINQEIPTSRMSASETAQPTVGGALMMNGVGGSTTHYTCQTWRFLPWNFKMKSETLKRYGPSMIPKDSLVADWPVSYDDLEPYYDKVEYKIGASGEAGNIKGKLTASGATGAVNSAAAETPRRATSSSAEDTVRVSVATSVLTTSRRAASGSSLTRAND
jgi:gluconate 2-dehydrogenase alpha chain